MARGWRFAFVALAALALAWTLVVTRPASAQIWQRELSAEIADQHQCEVAFLSEVIEREVDDRRVILAKVHCLDRRTFDAVRTDDLDVFRFTVCEERDVDAC